MNRIIEPIKIESLGYNQLEIPEPNVHESLCDVLYSQIGLRYEPNSLGPTLCHIVHDFQHTPSDHCRFPRARWALNNAYVVCGLTGNDSPDGLSLRHIEKPTT